MPPTTEFCGLKMYGRVEVGPYLGVQSSKKVYARRSSDLNKRWFLYKLGREAEMNL